MKVYAPGKLILSGEHAVVYGKPALAMAVNRYVTVTASQQFLPFVSFDFSDLPYRNRMSLSALRHLKNRIKDKYQQFLQGDFKIRGVLQKPFELAQFSLMLFFEMLNVKLTHGIKIHVRSDIPIGCGMGSSAATILSVVHALAHHFEMKLSSDVFYRLGLEAENMQHGRSSGLDLRVSLHGGCLYMQDGEIQTRAVPSAPLYLINTGAPQSSTGECVSQAAEVFKNSNIGDDFAAVTQSMDLALQQNNQANLITAVRENHKLLTKIGVVPEKINDFVTLLEKTGAAAKICGAGSVAGNNAGIMMIVTDDLTSLASLCSQYHFEIMPIAGENRGVHVV